MTDQRVDLSVGFLHLAGDVHRTQRINMSRKVESVALRLRAKEVARPLVGKVQPSQPSNRYDGFERKEKDSVFCRSWP